LFVYHLLVNKRLSSDKVHIHIREGTILREKLAGSQYVRTCTIDVLKVTGTVRMPIGVY